MDTAGAAHLNGSGDSHAWAESWTHFTVDRRSARYCQVTFDHPPANAITPTTVAELAELVELIETDEDLNVVAFGSANPDYYLSGTQDWLDVPVRLSRAPVLSIAAVRGRLSGAGDEFVSACDLRLSTREDALLERVLEVLVAAGERLRRGRAPDRTPAAHPRAPAGS
jgi:enoyl-CoA hydratase/carnithine racemase